MFLLVGHHLGHILGDHVHVLHGQHRQLDADHPANFARPEPAAVDDMLGDDGAVLGYDVPGVIRPLLQFGHAVVEINLGAADARRLGVGLRRALGIEITVGLVVERADEILLFHQRKELFRFRRCQQLCLNVEIAGSGVRHLQKVHTVVVVGQDNAARPVQSARLARDLFQLVIEPDGVALQLGDVRIAVQRVEPARRVPGRPRRQPRPLDQHHVLPARLGEMIQHRTANNAAADDRNAGVGFHVGGLRGRVIEVVAAPTHPAGWGCQAGTPDHSA